MVSPLPMCLVVIVVVLQQVLKKYIIPSTDARYVRVTINGNTQNNAASIYELDIFGSSSSAKLHRQQTTKQ